MRLFFSLLLFTWKNIIEQCFCNTLILIWLFFKKRQDNQKFIQSVSPVLNSLGTKLAIINIFHIERTRISSSPMGKL